MPDDDPLEDRRQYDPPVNLAVCPQCGGPLEFGYKYPTMAGPGYVWWCPGCECYVKNEDVAPVDHPAEPRGR